jgi:3-oxoacyl-[acyl-carrier protein] reductase
MALELEGRVALITGGSMGIGRVTALTLAREGANIAICARGKDDLESAAIEIRSTGRDALPVQADMTSHDDIQRFVKTAADHFGRVDILVNNAVTSYLKSFQELTDEEFNYHVDVKLLGYVRCIREVLPHMQQRRWGRIVNVAGMSARIIGPLRITSGVVNSAITNFTKQLADQVAKDNILINAVHPGTTLTPRQASVIQGEADAFDITFEEARQRRLDEIPLGRFVMPEDLANVILFFCSEASSAVTGQAIAVDGGSASAIAY